MKSNPSSFILRSRISSRKRFHPPQVDFIRRRRIWLAWYSDKSITPMAIGFLHSGINQRLIKTFQSLIDNQVKKCYNVNVIRLQIQPKEAIMMNTHIDRMSYVSPAVYEMQGLYGFWYTSDFGCVFCLPEISFFGKHIALCTRRGAFAPLWGLFSWKALEYESNGKFSKTERRIFYDDRNQNTFEKWKRGCPWRD